MIMKSLWQVFGFKPLMLPLNRINGRNNTGSITVFHRGGGCKRKLRFIDFKRSILNLEGIVKRIEYDPVRTSFIALVFYPYLFLFSYILLPEGLRIGDYIFSSTKNTINLGNALPLASSFNNIYNINVPAGIPIHNIEIRAGRGAQLVRSAGTKAFLLTNQLKNCFIALNSVTGNIIKVPFNSFATIGKVSNGGHYHRIIKKAGVNRLKGRRPTVRGVAMNPIDHPHGGGEGKTSGGRHPVSPWGWLTKGPKTRKGSFSLTYFKSKSQFILKGDEVFLET